jgi:signal transduction histidine kinase
VNLAKAIPSVPVVVSGDPVRLQQVLSNVLENALKHTNAGGTIEMRLQSGSRQATISVSDTGDGIPAMSFLMCSSPSGITATVADWGLD